MSIDLLVALECSRCVPKIGLLIYASFCLNIILVMLQKRVVNDTTYLRPLRDIAFAEVSCNYPKPARPFPPYSTSDRARAAFSTRR